MHWNTVSTSEKNTLVAKRVMNWQEKICEKQLIEFDGGWECGTCGLSGSWKPRDFDRWADHRQLPPRYAENMDAAWQVVAKMKEPDKDGPNHTTFADLCTELSDMVRDSSVFAVLWSITPDIICKAALMAVGAINSKGVVNE